MLTTSENYEAMRNIELKKKKRDLELKKENKKIAKEIADIQEDNG